MSPFALTHDGPGPRSGALGAARAHTCMVQPCSWTQSCICSCSSCFSRTHKTIYIRSEKSPPTYFAEALQGVPQSHLLSLCEGSTSTTCTCSRLWAAVVQSGVQGPWHIGHAASLLCVWQRSVSRRTTGTLTHTEFCSKTKHRLWCYTCTACNTLLRPLVKMLQDTWLNKLDAPLQLA